MFLGFFSHFIRLNSSSCALHFSFPMCTVCYTLMFTRVRCTLLNCWLISLDVYSSDACVFIHICMCGLAAFIHVCIFFNPFGCCIAPQIILITVPFYFNSFSSWSLSSSILFELIVSDTIKKLLVINFCLLSHLITLPIWICGQIK